MKRLVVFVVAATISSPIQAQMSSNAQAYLAEAIKQLRENHVNRSKVDWTAVEAEAAALAKDAKKPVDTYPAIRHVISALGEKHTTFEPPRPPRDPNAPKPPKRERPMPEVRLVDGAFGYVKVTQFGGSREAGATYASTLRDGVSVLDKQGACGWVVDLRGNGGGNVWPMIDGVGALMGESPFLTFDVPGQGQFKVLYANGVAYQEGATPPYAVAGFQPLRNPTAPVALLIDGGTASSAEALVVAFSGRPNVRSFGQPTADYITVNNPVMLSDSATINMTVGWNMDRKGRRFEHAIPPDQPTNAGAEEPLAAAKAWLANQQQCRRKAE